MEITGNSMIDGDPGTDPASPYFEKEDIIETDRCYWCNDEFPVELFQFYTENGNPVCDECVKNALEEGEDYKKELK